MVPVVGLLDVRDVGDGQVALGVHAAHAAQRRPRHGGAVVRVVAADDHLALGLPQQIPIAANHAHVGVVAFRATAAEKHVLETALTHLGRQTGQLRRELHRRNVGGLEKAVVEGQRHHLLIRRVGQFFAPVASVDAPQTAHGIQNLVTFGVPNVNAVGARDHARASCGQITVVGEGVDEVGAVQRLDGVGIVRFGTANHGGRGNRGRGGHNKNFQRVKRATTGVRAPMAKSPS